MKIVNEIKKMTSVVLTELNGHVDRNGNIQSVTKIEDWSLVSNHGGVDHFMKINRFNKQLAKHKFVNNTGSEILYKWSINIIKEDGQNQKYDFGTIEIKSQATSFSVSVPYKCSRLFSKATVSRIMVALMII